MGDESAVEPCTRQKEREFTNKLNNVPAQPTYLPKLLDK